MRKQSQRNTQRQQFPSLNYWGMPDLLPDMLVPRFAEPPLFQCYRDGKTQADRLLLFFCGDAQFQCAWNYPARMAANLTKAGITAAVEPNFSLWADAPRAEQMHATYRTRWCGRYFQERGIKIVPALCWSTPASYEWAWSGIPLHPPVCAVETRSCGRSTYNRVLFNAGLAAACAAVQPGQLLLYGTCAEWVTIPQGVDAMWLQPAVNKRLA